MHEASLYEHNCFITLTYDDENLPPGGSLVPEHFVNFMKRLRFHHGDGIRFFHCGEYGSKLGRPHHHALLFNHDFSDRKRISSGGKHSLFSSRSLADLWPHGFSSVGNASFQSAGYIARYTLKKVNGPRAVEWYKGRIPEYLTMSRRPGIGRAWIEKYFRDVYPNDSVVVNGSLSKPPRFYDDVAAKSIPYLVEAVKIRRRGLGSVNPNGTGKRLLVREVVKQSAIATLSRTLED
jgi:hypothetical protein